MFGLASKLAKKDARIKELEAQIAAAAPTGSASPATAEQTPAAPAADAVVEPQAEKPAPVVQATAKKNDDEDEEDALGDEDDGDEDEDLEEDDKKKAAGLAPLEAAQFRATCLRTKLRAAQAKEAAFEQRVTTEVTTRDADRQKTFDDKVGLRAQQVFAAATGAPLKANPTNKADGGAGKADTAALKGRAATIAAIKADRESGAGRTA